MTLKILFFQTLLFFTVFAIFGFFSTLLITPRVFAVTPFGANITTLNTSTAAPSSPGNASAQAGNVTEMNIRGFSSTQSWQGYFGNVTGTIQLADSADRAMYNWTLVNPRGEVYASTNQTISWNNIQCFNFTANGSYGSETGLGGTTNLQGTNLSRLESQYNINTSDIDGVNETFIYSGGTGHRQFFTSNNQFSAGECRNTRVYSGAGYGELGKFEEVLLYEPSTTSVVFASLIESDLLGFDGRTHDFELLVLEDGHGTNIASTPYYFFVELE